MHFSLRKTFSMLHTHRRTRSDTSPESPHPTHRTRSWSLTKIEELIFGSSSQIAPKPFYINSSSGGSTSYTLPASSQRPTFSASTPQVDVEPFTLESRLLGLQAENEELKEDIATLKLDARIREEELTKFRSDYYAERFKANVRRRLANASEVKSQAQIHQLGQAESFILSMIEVGLHQPVLLEAWEAVKAGSNSDDALVDAIKKAAAIPGTSWSTIIPAASAPQIADQHISTATPTFKTRKDLSATMKAAKFWKTTAKTNFAPDETVTPSPLDLSSTDHEIPDHGKYTAVDDLLNRLREDEIPVRYAHGSKGDSQDKVPAPCSVDRASGRARITARANNSRRVPVPSLSSITTHSASLPGPLVLDKVQECAPTSPCHAADLAPLASQIFKDQLAASRRSPRRLRPSPTKSTRPVFGRVDLNRSAQKFKTLRKVTEKQGTNLSAKALGKRKAIMITEDVQVITVPPPLRHSNDTSNTLHAVLDSAYSTNPCASPPPGSTQTAYPLCDKGTLSPEKALLSLERICAGFSSGSLGSLDMMSEDSEANIRKSEAVSNPLPGARPVPSAVKSMLDPASRTPPIFRKSILPVLKLRRTASASSSSSFLPVHPQPVAPRRVDSTMCGEGMAVSKGSKLVRKNTSPLRIKKKTMPGASDLVPRKPRTVGPMSYTSIARDFSGRFGSKRVSPIVS